MVAARLLLGCRNVSTNGLKLRFRVGVVVARMGSTMAFPNSQVGKEHCNGFGCHRGASVGMDDKISRLDPLLHCRVKKQVPSECGVFSRRLKPTHHIATEDIHDDIEVKVLPLRGPLSFVMSQDHAGFGPVASSSGGE